MPRPPYLRAGGANRQHNGQQQAKSEKLHKMLAAAGLGSRRDMEIMIATGRVSVNGQIVQVGDRVTENDVVRVDNRVVPLPWNAPQVRVLIYHKPEGEIVSRDDPKQRATVFDQLPKLKGERWIAVGRLDYNTEGLLLFTTSGDLANRLMHPRFDVEREYAVRVLGDELSPDQIQALKTGVQLEDGPARVENITVTGGEGANKWYQLAIKEGRNREVRRLFEALGLTVSRLIRVRYGPVNMPPRLKRGQRLELTPDEVTKLLTWTEKAASRQPSSTPNNKPKRPYPQQANTRNRDKQQANPQQNRPQQDKSQPPKPKSGEEGGGGKAVHPFRRRLAARGSKPPGGSSSGQPT